MKKAMSIFLYVICLIALAGCSGNMPSNSQDSESPSSTIEYSPVPTESSPKEETTGQETSAPSLSPSTPAKGSSTQGVTPKPNTQTSSSGTSSASVSSTPAESQTPEKSQEGDTMPTINIQVGNKNFTATFYDNESARTIVKQMPFTLEMDDFSSQEKVTDLSFDLPSAQTQTPAKINAGDIYLWSGNNLVLFYTTFSNSYSYVPVGHIDDVTGLKDALGSGSVHVTFSTNK